MEHLSDRLKTLKESATIAMAAKARELKSQGVEVISLSLGEPDFKTPKHIQEGAIEAIKEEKYFSYPPVPGYQDLREAIAEKLSKENNTPYKAENIVISNGAKHSIANAMYSLVNPGDEVIIYSPFWVSYAAIAELTEAKVKFLRGDIDHDFKASAAQLEEAITPNTKVVMFSSPCNPTGAVFERSDLEAMAEVLNKNKHVYAIADEIYEYINYTGEHVSLASLPGMLENTVTVNGFSKGYAMTGWRVGYLAAPIWIAKACNKIQGQITSANSSIAQRAAMVAISGDTGPTKEMAEEYLYRRDMVYDLLQDIPGVQSNLPKGAFYFFPNIKSFFGKSNGETTIQNASELCMYILNKAHVSVVTGDAFGDPDCLRISYAASRGDLVEALHRIKDVLAQLN